MESIDRLRAWWRVRFPVMDARLGREFREHVDAIESEVKANRVDAYTKGYDEGFASADDWVAQHDDAMAEHGWVRLPLDADGEPIHIGDVMETPDGETFEVSGIFYGAHGVMVDSIMFDYDPGEIIHHHVPTVEDVLREFFEQVGDGLHTLEAMDTQLIIAEYAAKLRLKED